METKRKGAIPKECFPQLLNSLWSQSSQAFLESLPSGFRACGYVPYSPEEVTKRLPGPGSTNASTGRELDGALLSLREETLLTERRGETSLPKPKRGKKIPHEPGVDIAAESIDGPTTSTAASSAVTEIASEPTDISNAVDDNFCFQCGIDYDGYTGSDWVQCLINCIQWFCGACKYATEDPFYVCFLCNGNL